MKRREQVLTDSLTGGGELLEERDDEKRALAVETGGRLRTGGEGGNEKADVSQREIKHSKQELKRRIGPHRGRAGEV
jgi:hypothetical protein